LCGWRVGQAQGRAGVSSYNGQKYVKISPVLYLKSEENCHWPHHPSLYVHNPAVFMIRIRGKGKCLLP